MLNPNEIRDLIEQDKFELLMRMPFFGRIICSSEFVIVRDPRVQMACTDYRRIFIFGRHIPASAGRTSASGTARKTALK